MQVRIVANSHVAAPILYQMAADRSIFPNFPQLALLCVSLYISQGCVCNETCAASNYVAACLSHPGNAWWGTLRSRVGNDRRCMGGRTLRALGWLLAAAPLATPMAARAQTEAVYRLGHFSFENGGEIPDMRVGYVTWGTLNAAKDNAILLVPGTSGNRHGYDAHIGPGKTFDTDKFSVIGADPIGGGTSSSPKDGLGIAFPKYTIRDMVHAQHDMVAKGLAITRLLAVGGAAARWARSRRSSEGSISPRR
jgi:hypothetical protein